jgi:hypothetical protein
MSKLNLQEIISEKDPIFSTLEKYNGNRSQIENLFEKIGTDTDKLYAFLLAYRRFNDQFAPCVIRLASDVHLFFWNSNQNAVGSEIAAGIYKACHHEYHESYLGTEWTHGRLSDICISMLGNSVGKMQKEIWSAKIDVINTKVREMYCEKHSLAKRLGFHIGSEFLAAFEFSLIDSLVEKNFPEIYTEMNTHRGGIEPWHWISIHTGVEIEHFKNALESYEKAKNYMDLKEVSEGIEAFAQIQEDFFVSIGEFIKP